MSEKQFTIKRHNSKRIGTYRYDIIDNFTDNYYLKCVAQFYNKSLAEHLCNLLNTLYEENEQLKYQTELLKEELSLANRDNDALEKENEQLKIKLEDIALEMENAKESNDDAQYELYKIKKKNEQLKQRIEYLERKIQRERKSNAIQNEKWEKEATDLIRDQRKMIDNLNKENEQLKHDATVLILANQDYRRENEELKQKLSDRIKYTHQLETELKKNR